MKSKLNPQEAAAVSRISGLVLINALVFQEVLSQHEGRVKPLQGMLDQGNPISTFSNQWKFILENINYYPIFHIARGILGNLSGTEDTARAIIGLAETAQKIVSHRAALRHDLMGRVYHRLLADKKYLATYYTSIPAATLLLKLALRDDAQSAWGNEETLASFRVADLTCGTGTLLMAAADAIADAHIRARARKAEYVDLAMLHRALTEHILQGYDVLASAIHLTASTLALRAPQISFKRMNLFSLPHGGRHLRLGSIEFLQDRQVSEVTDLFGAVTGAEQMKADQSEALVHAEVPPLDLCVMNPPFTRSVGGNLLFGSLPEADRKKMQKRLAELIKKKKVLANSTAGLGSVFVAIADRFIKPGGRIGLVLPKALLSGVAWDKTRELLRQKYRVEYIVASHDPERWNFSESTSLSEVLLVAVKDKDKDSRTDGKVVALNLWRNPTTAFEALAIFNAVRASTTPETSENSSSSIMVGEQKVGEAVAIPWSKLKDHYLWLGPAAFAQPDLVSAATELMDGHLWVPGKSARKKVALTTIGELGILGPDARDIHDGFTFGETKTAYAAFLNHDAKTTTTIAQEPNGYLTHLKKAKEGRPLRKIEHLWPLAGQILLAERLRLNTQKLAAIRVSEPVLSNMWWSVHLKKSGTRHQREKVLSLWLNSTLGLLTLFANREETEGAWVKFKKPVLGALPTIDLDRLSSDQLKQLSDAYDELAHQELQPFPHMHTDEVRAAIDKAIAKALHLPDFSILRTLLAQEPVVCLKRL
ncbi:MAG: hypothetical protein AAB393_14195 [Bacteroidota bacterium]